MPWRNGTDKNVNLGLEKEVVSPKVRGMLQENLHGLTWLLYSLVSFPQRAQMVQMN